MDVDELKKIGKEVRDEVNGDCFDYSHELKKRLTEKHGFTRCWVIEYIIEDYYYHYVLRVGWQPNVDHEWEGSVIVDCAFDQFGDDSGTDITVASGGEIEDVIVVDPAEQYIFANEFHNKLEN